MEVAEEDFWDRFKNNHPKGSQYSGQVILHQPYGFFIDLGHSKVYGLVHFSVMQKKAHEKVDFPDVGSVFDGVVSGFTENNGVYQVQMAPA